MAYIDVDKFAEKICNFQAIDEDAANKMIWLLRTFPTADVVPKSEVFLASSDAVKMLIECHGYTLTHDADIKEEVAREIFEEIEKIATAEGAYDYVSIQEIAELKKKYTETECTSCAHFVGCETACGGRICDEYKEKKDET